jgi:hypothetical protein
MSREVRKVPKGWEHPKDERGQYIALHDGYESRLASWAQGAAKWLEGLCEKLDGTWEPVRAEYLGLPYSEWDGDQPEAKDYMLVGVPVRDRTMLMMYETTSEGTPISPAFETPEELARWLVDNRASAFAGDTASYEAWLSCCRKGYAPSGFYSPQTGLISGVEGMHRDERAPQ